MIDFEIPEWALQTMASNDDLHFEYVLSPHPHLVVITDMLYRDEDGEFVNEEWVAVLDTVFDVAHISLRSESYVMQDVKDWSAEDIVAWFSSKIRPLLDEEIKLLMEES